MYTGIGGWDLGLERAGMKVVWQAETDPYRKLVLERMWPGVPNLGDCSKLLTAPACDVICAGFPCQPVSTAGWKAGRNDERWLWDPIARLVCEVRPRFVLVENVVRLTQRLLGVVLGDLAALGYDAEWDCIALSALGAPHERQRLWLVAYPGSERRGQESRLIFTPQLQKEIRGCAWWLSEPGVRRVADGVPGQRQRLAALGDSLSPQVAEIIGRQVVNA